MVSLLDAKLRQTVAKAFKGKLTKGTFRRVSSTSLNSLGDPVMGTPTDYAFEGIRATFSAFYKAQSGIPETDISILVIQGSLNPATSITKLDQDQLIFLKTPWNKWYKIRRVLRIDPANATAELQCYEIPDPV